MDGHLSLIHIFLLLPFNIFSTYYFQAILKPRSAFIVSVFRGLVISGVLIFILPLINPNALWLAMVLTEIIVAIYAGVSTVSYTHLNDVQFHDS